MVPDQVPDATAEHFGAKQLNGAAPEYDIRRNPSSTKWLLFLEGGGWCNGATEAATVAACANRAGFQPPLEHSSSSTKSEAMHVGLSTTDADYGGVLGERCDNNPGFCEWNAVFLHYRDGSSFGSFRSEPLEVRFPGGAPGAKMWMRGRASFDAIIADLQYRHGMISATEVILSGGSAGGLAVFYNLDHFAALLGDQIKLTGFPDAGYFLDHADVNGEFTYRKAFQGADLVWNVTGSRGTNEACLDAYPKAEHWKCLMAPYIAPFLKTPVFVMNSAFDAYQLPNILGTPCGVSTQSRPCNDSLAQRYGHDFVDGMAPVLSQPNNGAYVDSCWVHEQNVNYCSSQGSPNCVGWTPFEGGSKKWGYKTSIPYSTGTRLTPQQAFHKYYFEGADIKLLDKAALQANPSCIFTGKPVDEMFLV